MFSENEFLSVDELFLNQSFESLFGVLDQGEQGREKQSDSFGVYQDQHNPPGKMQKQKKIYREPDYPYHPSGFDAPLIPFDSSSLPELDSSFFDSVFGEAVSKDEVGLALSSPPPPPPSSPPSLFVTSVSSSPSSPSPSRSLFKSTSPNVALLFSLFDVLDQEPTTSPSSSPLVRTKRENHHQSHHPALSPELFAPLNLSHRSN